MCRFLTFLIVYVLSGCAHLANLSGYENPVLPNISSLSCCWQSQEQLEIEYQEKKFSISSVIAVYDNKLTVVFFDPLGRRVFTVTQQDSNIQIEKSELIQKDFPVRWLLIGIYLRNMPDNKWLSEHPVWEIKRKDNYVLLKQNEHNKIILTKITDQNKITSKLEYPDLKLKVNITTLSKNTI